VSRLHEPGTVELGTRNRKSLGMRRAKALAMSGARDHRELDVWKLSDELRSEVYRLVAARPMRTAPDLCRQLTRAAESACANLAEGFSRYLPGDMARFFRMTRGSHSEIIEHLTSAVRRKLLTDRDVDTAVILARRARGACTKLIVYLDSAKAPGRE
jgi:four helix bundle protein